ncbi:hypothetical protein M378DRAFT_310610 [Amanita muscaria Koide BX008]|uniref:NACHT domain-containing protein n=1 Tax=Amanita muscaria (strain Koide BX008) TaxID=946122 RepID=A0A0C2WQR9_AMAMK|nr:hypothetical protein M378DRAFT_310610 [Amanita muscaria Koide BX008]
MPFFCRNPKRVFGLFRRSRHHDTQAEGCNPFPNEHAILPVATQLQGAQVNMSGNPQFTNIGVNKGKVSTVNYHGGTHGLENLKEFVSFAALHDSAEQDHDCRCHPGTRKTVLGRLRDWFDDPNTTDRIIWLHGPAGAGKSAIAQTIAHEYKERGLAATFFFCRSDPERNDGNRLPPTITWQLAFSISGIKDFIVHALNKTPHLPRKDVESQFEQLVAHSFRAMNSIASHMPQFAPVVIIDGVDECSNEQLQRRILTAIGNAVKDRRVPLRFIICSRPEALIEETLDQFKDSILRIDLATLDDSHCDVEKYLVDQFSAIASKRGLDPTWPGQEIIKDIAFQSSGNFILPSTLIRFISDEECNPETQLDIVRKLKPHENTAPFALLDQLYLEILKQPRDQKFLKTFLALLVGRSSIGQDDLHEDDAMLMNIAEKDLHTKLRKMRSLLKFKPFIDVYHNSFLDFLQDSSRSGQYHVSKQAGLKRYLELVVDSVVQHVSMATNRHETCHLSPKFKSIVEDYPPKIVLPAEDWQQALKPLLVLQDTLLNTLKPKPCRVTQVMRDLLLHLVLLQGRSHHIAVAHVPESNMNETVTGWISATVTEATQNRPETDLDSCLSALLPCLQKTDSIMLVDGAIIDHMASLLAFDYAETASRIQSVSDAQKLVDLIDLLTNNESFLSHCGPDAARKAACLASEIFARVPLLQRSIILNGPLQSGDALLKHKLQTLEFVCQTAFISRILDHNYIVPVLGIYDESGQLRFVSGNENEQNESIDKWLKTKPNPNLVTHIRVVGCNDHLKNLVHFFLADARGSEGYPIHSFHGHRTELRFREIGRGFITFSMTIP